ncbi:MAG: UDP-N-acetylmuramoyl-L-alanyl-D-glutamate--2,6-diaminopimelate ligase [Gammaproteobacteria bacterium]|jgi:UDP-N-acetylmuramoyl-L-alanyl-D-glutamate--2,6-diaminopimelate ligase|nr:UDP-N-acetylmuramoyl-L-alanyl-D-glutamate--2,6-diaminopimelate ligase [Gammaproteobacteria bacterium]
MAAANISAMSLRQLFPDSPTAPDIRVCDITTHSGRVVSGGLFLACRGYRGHGLDYLEQALQHSPAAVVWEPLPGMAAPVIPPDVAQLRVPDLAEQVGAVADRFFGSPSQTLQVTGITGTNGKTTTAWLCAEALRVLGHVTGYMGTLGWGTGTELAPTSLTTPGCIVMHRRLRALRDAGAECAVLEASSHGLDQGRLDGVAVRTAAFTNLTHDHLDYHGDFASYGRAKERLFQFATLESVVINVGDEFGAGLATRCGRLPRVLRVAMHEARPNGAVDLRAQLIEISAAGLRLRLTGDFGEAELMSPLWGRFNAENLLVAAGILVAHGVPLSAAADALSRCAAPAGRMQVVRGAAADPLVVVDFAHTPDGLRQALQAMRDHCSGELSVVFGCGGERDVDKRTAMGQVAVALADRVVVTTDNPRSEDPAAIAAMIVADIPAARNVQIELDRAQAIRAAIAAAGASAAVLVAGKGSETRQYCKDGSRYFSDVDVVQQALGLAA